MEFGDPLSVMDGEGAWRRRLGGFFAGVDDRTSATRFERAQAGMQVNLTPRGALALAGMPQRQLARQVVPLCDVGIDQLLVEQLAHAAGWDARFELVKAFLEKKLAGALALSNVVSWAVDRVDAANGAVDVAGLARELGYSRKHLHHAFLEQVGLSPKRYADVRRFEHVRLRLAACPPGGLAQLAVHLGFVDQAHMAHAVRRFSGVTSQQLQHAMQEPLAAAVQGGVQLTALPHQKPRT
jgi:AraC-like DNA-binding protein